MRHRLARPLVIFALLAFVPTLAHARRRARGHRNDRQARAALTRLFAQKLHDILPPGLVADFADIPKSFFVRNADRVTLSFHGPPRPGHASVLCTVSRSGKVRKRGFLRVRIRKLHRVVVAARAIAAGTVLRNVDLRIAERATDEGFSEAHTLKGYVVLGSIAKNAVISQRDVTIPAVARGSRVKVVFRTHSMTLSTWATLEHSARPGQHTQARLHKRRLLVRGRLLDHETLLIAGDLP